MMSTFPTPRFLEPVVTLLSLIPNQERLQVSQPERLEKVLEIVERRNEGLYPLQPQSCDKLGIKTQKLFI